MFEFQENYNTTAYFINGLQPVALKGHEKRNPLTSKVLGKKLLSLTLLALYSYFTLSKKKINKHM